MGTKQSKTAKEFLPVKPYKGTRDFYPEQMRKFNWLFDRMTAAAEKFGYDPYQGPLLESVEIYAAKSGEELVNQQMYHLTDRGGRQVALRPELTPTLARMVAAKLNELILPVRWYNVANMFRYEKPQRGRTREHWQLNIDVLGLPGAEGDVEILQVAAAVMKSIGATPDHCVGYVNNRRFMMDFLTGTVGLNPDNAVKAISIIDRKSKVPADVFIEGLTSLGSTTKQVDQIQGLFELSLKDLEENFAEQSDGARELIEVFNLLKKRGLSDFYELNLEVVRGLAYYTGTVFEMFDKNPVNRRAMFGGGRYDNLISLFRKDQISGVGFALGDVVTMDFAETHNLLPDFAPVAQILLSPLGGENRELCHQIAAELRLASLNTEVYWAPDHKLKRQLKYANQKNFPFVAIIGTDEAAKEIVTLRDMKSGKQEEVPIAKLVEHLSQPV